MTARFKYYFRVRILGLLVSLWLFIASVQVAARDYIFSCVNGEITAGNSIVSLSLKAGKGDLQLKSITNEISGKRCYFTYGSKLFCIPAIDGVFIGNTVNRRIVPATETGYEYQLVEVISEFDRYTLKRVIRIYKESPFITFDFYIKIINPADLSTVSDSTYYFDLSTFSDHWKFTAVEFLDQTDWNNNLISVSERYSFWRPVKLRGNLLIACNIISDFDLILVKEAPCSGVQLLYPGYDFINTGNRIKAVNLGISDKEIDSGTWTRTYGFAIGLTDNDEYDYLTAIRTYQKHYRKIIPERDEMIMMNTWGDRGAGLNISDTFVREEIDACRRLGVTHFQIDDGWQLWSQYDSSGIAALNINGFTSGDWLPSPERFPAGLSVVTEYAKQNGIKLGLWFVPDKQNDYAGWKEDAGILTELFKDEGISFFKIDAVTLANKKSEINFRHLLDSVIAATNGQVHFNLDVTASTRGGYFFLYEYGNLFLENRYTDWGNYYPYQTLRNIWMLSRYVAPERIQVEFLNNHRNPDKYRPEDPFAPGKVPFEYIFAITIAAQPLAWFEGSNLYPEAFAVSPVIMRYRELMNDFHSGVILPVGKEPDGMSFTGFQSVKKEGGYLLLFREGTAKKYDLVTTWLPANRTFDFELLLGDGKSFSGSTDCRSELSVSLPGPYTYALYRYNAVL